VPLLEVTLSLPLDMPVPWLKAWTPSILANIARVQGDFDAARARVDEAVAFARAGGMNADLPIDAAARLARASGKPDHAESLHHEALNAAVEAESVLFVPMQLEAIAGVVTLREGFSEAARLLGAAEAARDTYGLVRYAVDESGYQADVNRVRNGLSQSDLLTAWQQGRAMSLDEAVAYSARGRGERKRPSLGWASLTPTEVEVVCQVAEGLTNPQIAGRLFVSRSTVKTHLSHIFAKLGVSTRAELAAAATRRGL
jgi:DNA-binding CsgD family transcriptional regulator